MRRQIMFTALLALLLIGGPGPALAADTVQVTLPSFSVTLNGQTNGNDYSRYPLIVYKNITYFPMTYYDCRLLGLKTDWTAGTGLVIDKNEDYFYEYRRDVTSSKNARTQTAKLADGKITVNGKVIDNGKEEYPLLVFRDITYFPLTWRFAVNEFGWDYRFDKQAGLVIGNDKVKLENPEEWYLNDDPNVWIRSHSCLLVEIESYLNPKMYSSPEDAENVLSLKKLAYDRNTLEKLNHGKLLSARELRKISQDPEAHLNMADFIALKKDISIPILLDNMSPVKNFVDARMEYQIHKKVGNQDELVYRYLLPPFHGDRLYYLAKYEFTTGFLFQKDLTTGTYKVSIQHPDYFHYRDPETQTLQQFPLDAPSGNACFDEFEFQIVE